MAAGDGYRGTLARDRDRPKRCLTTALPIFDRLDTVPFLPAVNHAGDEAAVADFSMNPKA
jgi:hypothetical protein